MPTEWILLIAVLLLAVIAGCFVIRRDERREKPWQIVEAEKADTSDAVKEPPFDIPVLRDKPKIKDDQ